MAKPRARITTQGEVKRITVDGAPSTGGVLTRDSFANFSANLGYDNSLTNLFSRGSYGFNPITRNRIQLEWMYRGSWIVGACVDAVAEDMTRAGISLETDDLKPDEVLQFDTDLDELRIWNSFCEALKWGRLYGGAGLVPIVEGQDLGSELKFETVSPGSFKGLLPLDRWMVQPTLWDLVKEPGPQLGLPKYYRVLSNAPALIGQTIHHSRFFRFIGHDLPFWQKWSEQFWGMSVIERLFDRLVGFDTVTMGAMQLVFKAHLRTMKVEKLREIIGQGGPLYQAMLQNVGLIRQMQSNEGIAIIDAKDELDTTQYSFGGLAEIMLQAGEQISGATEIPLVRLFGQSPAGLNSTGESDLRMYYDSISRRQEQLRPAVMTTLRLMAANRDVTLPEGFSFRFNPLWQLDDKEKGDAASKITTTVLAAFEAGLIDKSMALRELQRSAPLTGAWGTITDEEIESAAEEP
ncbi:MAG TPA: DUF1073 domain-containing protein, partial [Candidatus Cybelea sp.]